ncbi:MAG: CoA ester lyase [Rhodospirillales bacterium]|nr:CoA ester lyase [Rhodospirillales bacterium]
MRSKLFVPGSRPELFAKAMASAADAVSFDLEDAVAAERKAEARACVAAMLDGLAPEHGKTVIVRVNPTDGRYFADDLAAIIRDGLDMVNIPKAETALQMRAVAAHLGEIEHARGIATPIRILANIETPRGLRLAAEIAAADPRIAGLQLGLGDLFEPHGIARTERETVRAIQLAMRLAAAEAGIPAYDGAFVNVGDPDGFRAEAAAARRLGYSGKSCIHPSQIALANDVFRPSAAEIAHARRVLAAAETQLAAGTGAFLLDGVMIDEPFIAQARAVIAQS